MNKKLFFFISFCLIALSLIAQTNSQNITIRRNTHFQDAIKVLENMSLQFERRNIVNLSSYNSGIPIQINNLPWNEALHLIVNTLDLQIEERPGVFIITDIVSTNEVPEIEIFEIDKKMVKIHATFFYADRTFLNSMGIDWSTLIDGKVNAQIDLSATGGTADLLSITGSHSFQSGNTTVDVNALFKFFETNQKGSVLARPTVMVLSGREGYIQVGQDFSIKTLDEAGNTVDQFFSTGIILTVRPTILEDEDFEAIHLETSVENSSAIPAEYSTIINKNQVRTGVILCDGEETVLAGLIDNDNTKDRGGVPILKDLPWWVFGLRYIFGFETTRSVSREMIVVLKTEIVAPARDRALQRNQIRESLNIMRDDFEKIELEIKDY